MLAPSEESRPRFTGAGPAGELSFAGQNTKQRNQAEGLVGCRELCGGEEEAFSGDENRVFFRLRPKDG